MMHGTMKLNLIFVVPCIMLYSGEKVQQDATIAFFIRNAFTLHVSGETVTGNMYSKAIANKKRNCCILLDLFHHMKLKFST